MARTARQKQLYSTYFITQCCQADAFSTHNGRAIFMDCLVRAIEQYGILILAVEAKPLGYALIIYDNGNDISQVMRSINISFIMRYQHPDVHLNTRFKSKIIGLTDDLIREIERMPRLPVADSTRIRTAHAVVTTQSFCDKYFANKIDFLKFLDRESTLLPCRTSACHWQNSADTTCFCTLEDASQWLNRQLLETSYTMTTMLANKHLRNGYILYIRRHSTLTLKDIGHLFGGMSESAVSKLIKRKRHKGGTNENQY